MIIKVATARDDEGNIQWTHLYSAAIRNRLRRDKNLSDLTDIAAARRNLGVESNINLITQELEASLKRYIDAQDVSYDTAIRTYIKNNIEGSNEVHGTLSLHHEQIAEILNQLSSQTGPDIDSRFNELWEDNIKELWDDIKSYIINILKPYATQSYVNSMTTGMATQSWVTDAIVSAVTSGMARAKELRTPYTVLKDNPAKIEVETDTSYTDILGAFTYLMGNYPLKAEAQDRADISTWAAVKSMESILINDFGLKKNGGMQ